MKIKSLLLSLFVLPLFSQAQGVDTIVINDVNYHTDVIIDRDLGPGVNYKRLRIPKYPLNVNILMMDLNNPYNRIETMQASETLYKTEKLASAYKRLMTDEKRPLAGANGNFWCVSTQEPHSDLLIGATYNANLRNGKIITETNGHSDKWDGGPSRTGVIAVDTSKKLWIQSLYYAGSVSNDKIGNLTIQQVNKVVRDNEIGLYNGYYGKNKAFQMVEQYKGSDGKKHWNTLEGIGTEVYLTVNEGQRWMAGEPMTCTVAEVKTDAGTGTLGNYDLCLVGRGTNKDALASLVTGDQVTINYSWSTEDGVTPIIEQAIGGNAIVMLNGEMTGRNDDESYNTQVYSRTAYGCSADGKTLYIIVIDKSTDPVYGVSAGCNTRVMCQIIKHYGCSNLCNVDAGGSAQMMVKGEVINKTTENSPRAVANGWFLFSIAPQDDVIARLEFDDVALMAPPYSTYEPKILGYNQYGDLINDNVQGFTLTCDESVGTTEGSSFIAGGNACVGNLTATYNGVSVTKPITIKNADLAIRIKPLMIDAAREYSMEVTATIDQNVYVYDPSRIAWTIENNEVVNIDENGILRGLKEGKSMVVGTIGEFTDTTYVTVEIASAAKLYPSDWTGWTAKGSGVSSSALAEDGTLSFSYSGGRSVYTQISKDMTFYSLPDKLWLSFTPTVNIESISVDLRTQSQTRTNWVEILPTSGTAFVAGETHVVEIPISALGEPSDLILYPISLHCVKFTIEKNDTYKGEQSIKLNELSAEYYNYSAGVENVSVEEKNQPRIYPNPVTDGVFSISSGMLIKKVDVYSVGGAKVVSQNVSDYNVTVNVADLISGVYVVVVESETGNSIQRIIVK